MTTAVATQQEQSPQEVMRMTTAVVFVPKRDRTQPHDLDWLLRWVIPEPNSGCWIWGGSLNKNGYGSVGLEGRTQNAHRVAWRLAGRAIPEGYDLDHKCRVRCCINPDHLEPVTRSENLRRGMAGEVQRARTHCRNGHSYTADNVYIDPKKGRRNCRECRRAKVREWRARERKANQ